ncbi:MAG: hypothetical protein DMG61_19260 [Acidobacteria bacterium]|nr:MAG: hypothetical protein DMG61_19260 [Acidobacteriota bacterium]
MNFRNRDPRTTDDFAQLPHSQSLAAIALFQRNSGIVNNRELTANFAILNPLLVSGLLPGVRLMLIEELRIDR